MRERREDVCSNASRAALSKEGKGTGRVRASREGGRLPSLDEARDEGRVRSADPPRELLRETLQDGGLLPFTEGVRELARLVLPLSTDGEREDAAELATEEAREFAVERAANGALGGPVDDGRELVRLPGVDAELPLGTTRPTSRALLAAARRCDVLSSASSCRT